MTHGHALGLGEEARLQLAAKAITVVRQLDPTTPLVVTFDQPWAEYLASEQLDWRDAFCRRTRAPTSASRASAWKSTSATSRADRSHRGPLAFSRLVDNWSLLELPLLVTLTLPVPPPTTPGQQQRPRAQQQDEDVTPKQWDWINEHNPLLLAKNAVQVVLWNQLSDATPPLPAAEYSTPPTKAQAGPRGAPPKIRQQYLNDGK